MLGLHCWVQAFSSCSSRGLLSSYGVQVPHCDVRSSFEDIYYGTHFPKEILRTKLLASINSILAVTTSFSSLKIAKLFPYWKKPVWKGYLLQDSNATTFWKGKTMETIKLYSGCQELETGVNREHRNSQGSQTILYIKIICCLLLFSRSVVSDSLRPHGL